MHSRAVVAFVLAYLNCITAQVWTGEGLRVPDSTECPATAIAVPARPAGSSHPIFYYGQSGRTVEDENQTPGPLVKQCCQSGSIAFWNLTSTGEPGSNFIGAMGALCSDGDVLPAVIYGANGTDPDACDAFLAFPQIVSAPENGTYSYWNGAILNTFLGVGGAGLSEEQLYSVTCPEPTVAIGFAVASSCFALTQFQVICGDMTDDSSKVITDMAKDIG